MSRADRRFADQRAVVVGGASGIGAACAQQLAEEGATVCVADLDGVAAEHLAVALNGSSLELDVSAPESVNAAVRLYLAQGSAPDILVITAGVTHNPISPEELSLEVWRRTVEINLFGTYVAATGFGQAMAEAGHGAIVTVASMAGMRSFPLHAYGPSKAGVINLTENLAAEWGRSGVRVNCVSPGYTRTPLLQGLIDSGDRDLALLTASSALGRLIEPEEIASLICYLASDEASAVTGVNVPIDGGWLTGLSWHTYGGLPAARQFRS